jgi:aspartyl/asparaginyl-tRNA synthetase
LIYKVYTQLYPTQWSAKGVELKLQKVAIAPTVHYPLGITGAQRLETLRVNSVIEYMTPIHDSMEKANSNLTNFLNSYLKFKLKLATPFHSSQGLKVKYSQMRLIQERLYDILGLQKRRHWSSVAQPLANKVGRRM